MSETCRGCTEKAVDTFFDLGEMPLAGGFLSSEAEIADERRYPLAIGLCSACGLVQISNPVDASILFSDYSFATGTIPGLVRHFDAYADWISERFAPKTVVEFGANDGTLVAALGERGIRALGVDLAPNITDMARERGLDMITGAFAAGLAPELRKRAGGDVDLVTGSNVFAHNDEPGLILEGADALLHPDGLLCLEFMYAGDLLEQLQWDTLYHEHLTFYSLGTVSILLGRFGFEPVEAERIPMHGGSLRVAAARAGTRKPAGSIEALRAAESKAELNAPATWERFAEESRRRIRVFGETMRRLADGASIWAYGAAGKATMWVNACEMEYLGAVVDASPLRAGKLMPGTHTPIVSPEEFRRHRPSYVFASAWNYLDAIRANEAAYEGAWIVPLPEMRIS